MEGDSQPGVRLAEAVSALSLAIDLGLGLPMEHVLRQTVVALRLAEAMDLPDDDRAAVYYTSLLAWVGCTADSREMSAWFGDDNQFRAGTYAIDTAGVPMAAYTVRRLGSGRPLLQRLAVIGQFLAGGVKSMDRMLAGHCEVASQLAGHLGLGPSVCSPLLQVFERWDGKGTPAHLKGDQVALPMRIVHLADIVEVFHRVGGPDAAVTVARERQGAQFDPALVDLFCDAGSHVLDCLEDETTWDEVIAAQPALGRTLSDAELDTVLEAFADYTDLKSPDWLGHSRGVAALAEGAARRVGLPAADVTMLRRAGLVHDLGAIGVANEVWDKRGPLAEVDRERVRTHPYLAERTLARSPGLAAVGALAALHHERLDGTGYPRGLTAEALPTAARVLAAADVYHALVEDRPHRPAVPAAEAAGVLRAEVSAGRLDGEAVNGVLAAAGHRVRRRASLPAGLTPREVEVLVLLARGLSNRIIAERLVISPKTVNAHVEHIYTKLGVSTRPSAALFALRHGFLPAYGDSAYGDSASVPPGG